MLKIGYNAIFTARIAYSADFFQSQVPRSKRYLLYLKAYFLNSQFLGFHGQAPCTHLFIPLLCCSFISCSQLFSSAIRRERVVVITSDNLSRRARRGAGSGCRLIFGSNIHSSHTLHTVHLWMKLVSPKTEMVEKPSHNLFMCVAIWTN